MIIEPERDLLLLAEQVVTELGHEPLTPSCALVPDVLLAATSPEAVALARAVRDRHRVVPIVFAGIRPACPRTAALAGAVHILKPYSMRDLARAIERALGAG